MKILKGIALSLLGIILFLSLSLFGTVYSVKSTILNPHFVVKELDKLDISALAEDIMNSGYMASLPPEAAQMLKQPQTKAVFDSLITSQEPWLKEQLGKTVFVFYDYMLGKSDAMNMTVQLAPLKAELKSAGKQYLQTPGISLPQGVQPEMVDFMVDTQIPASFNVFPGIIPPDAMQQLQEVRQYLSYLNPVYWGLLGFIVLLVLVIVLIQQNLAGTARVLGIDLLTYGALEFIGILIFANLMPQFISPYSGQAPPSVITWLNQVIADLNRPLQIFSLFCAATGILLLFFSVIYPRIRRAEA